MNPTRVLKLQGVALFIILIFFGTAAVAAQEAGGDLGGGAGVFRPKNPETSNKTRTRPNTAHPRNPGKKPVGRSAAEIAADVEDFVDQGNQARDAKKFSDAERAYKSALHLNAREWRASYGLGNVYTDQQRWEEAEQYYREAVQASSSNADSYLALSYVLSQPRSGGSQAKRLADAEAAARRAILLQPNNAIAYDRLGAALEARGLSGSDIEQAYRKSIDLDPQFAVAYVHLADFIAKDPKRGSEAEPFYNKAIELAKDAPTLTLIGEAMQTEQRYGDSVKSLKAALDLDPKNPSALFLLGRAYVVLKQYSDAEMYLQRAIEISPKSFEPYQILGSAYLRENRLPEAEEVFTKASAVAPPQAKKQLAGLYGLGGLGDSYASAGKTRDAVRVYQAALRLDPQNSDIQKKLSDLNAHPN